MERRSTKFLVSWDHHSGPSAVDEVLADLKSGVIKEWLRLVGTTRGYATIDVRDVKELHKVTRKYHDKYNIIFTNIEPVLSMEEFVGMASSEESRTGA